ncbi:MAG: hypothetical protein IH945_06140 [Armatimonadetes bacterium]|nr:hypothetical protein [Armatimonadota bacterium]
MQTIVAGLMALTAMGAGIVSNADSVTVVARGAIAYVVGMLLAGIWTMVVSPGEKAAEEESDASEDDEVESEDEDSDEDEEEDEDEEAA